MAHMPVELAARHVAQLGAQPREVEHGRAEPAMAACEARRGTSRRSAWRGGGGGAWGAHGMPDMTAHRRA